MSKLWKIVNGFHQSNEHYRQAGRGEWEGGLRSLTLRLETAACTPSVEIGALKDKIWFIYSDLPRGCL